MGIKCPKCKSTNTEASGPGRMLCNACAYSWKPYKHRGKKMVNVGDGIFSSRRKAMPGSKTEIVGDNVFGKKRVKKKRKKSFSRI